MPKKHKQPIIPERIKAMLASDDPEVRRQGEIEMMLYLDATKPR